MASLFPGQTPCAHSQVLSNTPCLTLSHYGFSFTMLLRFPSAHIDSYSVYLKLGIEIEVISPTTAVLSEGKSFHLLKSYFLLFQMSWPREPH